MTRSAARPGPAEPLAALGWTGVAVVAAVLAALGMAWSGAGSAATPGLASAGPLPVAVRALADAAAVAAVGVALAAVLVPPPGRERAAAGVLARADRGTLVAAGTWLAAVLASVVVRSAEAFGRPVSTIGPGDLGLFVTRIAAGRGLVLAALCAAAVLGCAVARLRDPAAVPPRVVLVVALLGAITPSVTGHTGASPDHQLAVVLVALHAGAAALWVGGLAALLVLVAPRPALLASVLPRFSLLATVCLAATAVTGIANALLRLAGTPDFVAALTGAYAMLVLAKTGCIAVAALLGLLARRRLAAGRLPVLRWAGLEITVLAVAIGLAATLSQTAT